MHGGHEGTLLYPLRPIDVLPQELQNSLLHAVSFEVMRESPKRTVGIHVVVVSRAAVLPVAGVTASHRGPRSHCDAKWQR